MLLPTPHPHPIPPHPKKRHCSRCLSKPLSQYSPPLELQGSFPQSCPKRIKTIHSMMKPNPNKNHLSSSKPTRSCRSEAWINSVGWKNKNTSEYELFQNNTSDSVRGNTAAPFILSLSWENFPVRNNDREVEEEEEEEEVESVRPEVSAPQAGTRMKQCGWMLRDGVQLISSLSLKLSRRHLLCSPAPWEKKGEKDRSLTNPVFPRDRGDIREWESAGMERQTGTQSKREGGRECNESIYPPYRTGLSNSLSSALHHSRAQRRVLQPRTPPRSRGNEGWTDGGRYRARGMGGWGEVGERRGGGGCWQVAVPYGGCCIAAAHARDSSGAWQ